MKIYVVYTSGDHACAVYVATDRLITEKAVKDLQKKGVHCYIEKYDLTNDCLIELDCS